MKKIILLFLVITSCDKSERLPAVDIQRDKYYTSEIIPETYFDFYGRWRAVSVTGGFSGIKQKPEFDYLVIRRIGIYAVIKNDQVVEDGKIELNTFDNQSELLQVKFITNSSKTSQYLGAWPSRYVEITEANKLQLISACCDGFDYQFERIR
jgi:hypothetical protein